MTIARRTAFAASAGIIAAQALPAAAQALPAAAQTAAAPAAAAPTAQAPGFYRFKVGGWTITTVHDGFNRFPVASYITNAPADAVRALMAESLMTGDTIMVPFTITFAQKGDTFVVFDAGNGVTAPTATNGRMIANMAAAGISPAAITHVIHSHFHGDHIGGLLNAENGRAFPNAEIIVPATEWAWWTEAANETRSPERQRPSFANTARRFAPYQGRVRQITAGEVIPGITAIDAFGHTPGQTIYRVSDGADQMMFLADVLNRPEIMMRRPGWHFLGDFDADTAVTTRRRVLDMVAADRVRVTGYHYVFPANGYVARHGAGADAGYAFVPAEWSSAI